jgi:DUF4097 and DUF4098 domain-containing protein YvlB
MLLLLAVLATASFQDTDTTVSVRAGSRLNLDNFDGAVSVTTWSRSAVRVQATHDDDTRVDVDVRGGSVDIRGRSRYGPPEVEYRLTVPADMLLEISTHSGDITVEGSRAEVALQTVEGKISVTGGADRVSISSVEGDVDLTGASGRINISAVDGGVTVRNTRGDLQINAVDGAVRLDNVDASNLEASTVDGAIDFTGTIQNTGRYRLSSHDGNVTVTVPSIDASISVSTYEGDFDSDWPVTISSTRSRQRLDFVLGKGSARVELESFDGNVRLLKSGRRP